MSRTPAVPPRSRAAAEVARMHDDTRASLDAITDLVLREYRVSRGDLMSPLRTGPVAEARRVAMYLASHYARPHDTDTLDAVLPGYFGRDRSTVAWALTCVESSLEGASSSDRRLKRIVEKLTAAVSTLP